MLQPKNGGERAQRPVHRRTVGKDVQHIWIDYGDVSALGVSRRSSASNRGGEVVLRPHRVALVSPIVTTSFFLHSASTRVAWPAWLRSSGCAVAAFAGYTVTRTLSCKNSGAKSAPFGQTSV